VNCALFNGQLIVRVNVLSRANLRIDRIDVASHQVLLSRLSVSHQELYPVSCLCIEQPRLQIQRLQRLPDRPISMILCHGNQTDSTQKHFVLQEDFVLIQVPE